MNIWEGIQNAIRYIEYSLTEEPDIADIAAKANFSGYFRAVRLYGGRIYPQPQVQYGRLLQRDTEVLAGAYVGQRLCHR